MSVSAPRPSVWESCAQIAELGLGGREGRGWGTHVVDLCLVVLCDALRDPDDVPGLLLLQLDDRVEDAEVELHLKGLFIELCLKLEAPVLKGLVTRAVSDVLEQRRILWEVADEPLHLLGILAISQHEKALREERADGRVQLEPVVLIRAKLGVERVYGDVEGAAVGLELGE